MKNIYFFILSIFILSSCSSRKELVYLNDTDTQNINIISYSNLMNDIEVGDILKIDVRTIVPEAVIPYNQVANGTTIQNYDLLKLDGYLVDNLKSINFPVLGKINVEKLNINQLENKITKLLLDGGHLTNPNVRIQRVNSKFTILGEVKNPGTFSYFDEQINIFQALGYAGDLTIDGKRQEITLIREKSGLRSVYKLSLTDSDLLQKPYYQIKNNDIIIVEPNFSKVKSAGFIGSASSIASISSILLSITLLIINNR